MGLLASIKKLFAPPRLVATFAQLEPGQVVVEGTVRAGAGGTLSSPIKGQPCVAFFYNSSHRTPGRQTGTVLRSLRHVEVFTTFELELDGGRLRAVPLTPGAFAREDHQKLVDAGYQQFEATEQLLAPRSRVRLWGVARRKDDGWVVTYRRIEKLAGADKKPGKRSR